MPVSDHTFSEALSFITQQISSLTTTGAFGSNFAELATALATCCMRSVCQRYFSTNISLQASCSCCLSAPWWMKSQHCIHTHKGISAESPACRRTSTLVFSISSRRKDLEKNLMPTKRSASVCLQLHSITWVCLTDARFARRQAALIKTCKFSGLCAKTCARQLPWNTSSWK